LAFRLRLAVVGAGGLVACVFPDYTLEQDPASVLARICSDGLLSGAETGVDCGGGCPPCAEDQPCKMPSDCLTRACPDGLCRPASCQDGVENGSESDRDCGGQCDRPCDVGDNCGTAAECASRVCSGGSCQAPACNDGVRNGDETGVDCGGSCSECGIGAACAIDADCVSGKCAQLLCVAPQCTDGSVNGDETGVDCGGMECGPCAPGEGCRQAADCKSSSCDAASHCTDSRCDDQIHNGSETDLDCGGLACGGCAELQACKAGSDCASGVCQSELCVPAAPSGTLIAQQGWSGSASHTFPGDAPSDAFDNDLDSIWSTGAWQEPGMFFQVDLATVRAFYSVELECSVAGDAPGSLDIYLWQSGEPAAPARTQVVGLSRTSIEFATPQVARYIRLVLAESKSAWWCIGELYVRQ
jgi:hypothetical protein